MLPSTGTRLWGTADRRATRATASPPAGDGGYQAKRWSNSTSGSGWPTRLSVIARRRLRRIITGKWTPSEGDRGERGGSPMRSRIGSRGAALVTKAMIRLMSALGRSRPVRSVARRVRSVKQSPAVRWTLNEQQRPFGDCLAQGGPDTLPGNRNYCAPRNRNPGAWPGFLSSAI